MSVRYIGVFHYEQLISEWCISLRAFLMQYTMNFALMFVGLNVEFLNYYSYEIIIAVLIILIIIMSYGGIAEIKEHIIRRVIRLFKGGTDVDTVARSLSRLKISIYQVKSERVVENLVVEHLRKRFKKVHSQYSVGGNLGLKIDVDVLESVGIEIKLAKQIENSTANMMRLFGQAVYYSRRKYGKDRVLVLIVGQAKYQKSERFQELFKYLEKENIEVQYLKTV